MKQRTLLALLAFGAFACNTPRQSTATNTAGHFDWQAHRGGRGLMPENTIPAMLHAIDLGVTTLEMDTHISKDGKVVVSHDPYFNENFTTTPEGKTLTKEEAALRLLYTMPYDSIAKYDVGLKQYPAFPQQQKMAVHKPLLSDLLAAAETHAKEKGATIRYNIEIKSKPSGDDKKHPPVEDFVNLVMNVVQQHGTAARTTIQSFDPRALQVMHRRYPDVATSLLVEGSEKRTLAAQLQQLGFVPTVYSPAAALVTPDLIRDCHQKGMQVIPWTVNTAEEIRHLKNMGVDGIISDYPNLFAGL